MTHRKFAAIETLTQGDAHSAQFCIIRLANIDRMSRHVATEERQKLKGGRLRILRKLKRILRHDAKK
ncbi:hypothetical protein [Shinella sumterensis]|uniref:hypothetical protein n=1 Tax=Shinella sumterensis TaxID=1967501 RepID=UPI00106EE48D|nr:hypothetical protein [Shinella sumterensis]MCD1262440.1 hypothetical protein [Shinella sumterensis]